MKRLASIILITATVMTPLWAGDSLSESTQATEELWRTGSGAHDGAYTAISTSMIGWGIGLAVGIAILAATLNHGSGSSGSSSHAHTCH